ncbi:MAG: preprotein translocase subunit YajC [Bacteroidales bacterium]|nr:preprotein translocase subunit YajC [Bacteroidales bacterium]
MNILYILLQAQSQGGSGMSLWVMILIFIVIWWLMMRPQQKRAKEERKFRESLKKGDRVLFSGGIYGKVHEVNETTVIVEVGNGVMLTVEKSMIQPAPEAKEESK